jgi:hypothetical protein
LLPFPQQDFGGRVVRLADYFDNSCQGQLRVLKKSGLYQAVPQVDDKQGIRVQTKNLFRCDTASNQKVIYLHDWN